MEWQKALFEWSLYYINQGFSIVPVTGLAKAPPLIKWDVYQTRQPTSEESDSWWEKWPDANIAIVTGKVSGISVVDLDGEQGMRSAAPLNLPSTLTVTTPKGRHLYYAYNPALHTGAAFLPGIDVRNDGG